MALFAVEGLNFSYPGAKRPALVDASLLIEEGSFSFLLGRNGSGKSTLLRSLKPLIAPAGTRSGRILFRGSPLDSLSPLEQSRRIGFVFQDARAQLVADTPLAEIAFGLESLGVERETMRARIAETCSYLGMTAWLDAPLAELSGGQLQLVNLAAVLAMEPEAIIVDEPFSGLDPIAAERLASILERLNRVLGITIVASGHALPANPERIDQVIVMREGAVMASDTIQGIAPLLMQDDPAMLAALPTATRIALGARLPDPDDPCSKAPRSPSRLPITVRDGRRWLEQQLGGCDCHPEVPSCATPFPASGAGSLRGHGEAALRIEDAWFRYAKRMPDVLRGVDFRIERGSIAAIIGANGSGKTTLLRCACGLLRPSHGTIRLSDRPAGRSAPPSCAMLSQEPRDAFSKDTVSEELAEMAEAACCAPGTFAERLSSVIEACRLDALLDQHPFDLSGGQAQRLGIAKALLSGARLLLLDEPTRCLDAPSKRELASTMRTLADAGCTIAFATHDLDFCAEHADAVTLMFDGQASRALPPRQALSANAYYTTDASRMSRGIIPLACTVEDVIEHVEAAR